LNKTILTSHSFNRSAAAMLFLCVIAPKKKVVS
jgi:hypothetical protein